MIILDGDILESKEKYIAHQCNCVSTTSSGLAAKIFKAFPYADDYKNRITKNIPGNISIRGDGLQKRFVINMFAQFYPGKPSDFELDSAFSRQWYFNECLNEISLIDNLESIAFPFNIGCGLAGGNWEEYLYILSNFSDMNKSRFKTVLYKYE